MKSHLIGSLMFSCLLAMVFSALCCSNTSAEPLEGYRLVWADEFEKAGPPDPEKWAREEGFRRNEELQYYTVDRPQNAQVENGNLIIEARKEKYPNAAYDPESRDWRKSRKFAEYTSASLHTFGKASWTYGRIEVRAKIPHGRGMWPAIWMLGINKTEVGWPECGEIDIMEFVGHDPNVIHANVHTEKYNHSRGTGRGHSIKVEKPYADFHVYAVEWTPEKMDFYFDDRKYFTVVNDEPGKAAWPFDAPHYLILNAAVGGSWGGQKGVDPSIFPQQYLIDYVRVYQKK